MLWGTGGGRGCLRRAGRGQVVLRTPPHDAPAGPGQARGHTEGGWTLTTHRNVGSTPQDPSGLQDPLLECVQRDCTSGLSSWHPTARRARGPQLRGPGFVSKLSNSEPAPGGLLNQWMDGWMSDGVKRSPDPRGSRHSEPRPGRAPFPGSLNLLFVVPSSLLSWPLVAARRPPLAGPSGYVRKTRTPWRRAWTRPGSMDMLNELCWSPTVHTWPCSAAWRTITVSLLAMTVFRTEMTTMGNTKDMKVLIYERWRGAARETGAWDAPWCPPRPLAQV